MKTTFLERKASHRFHGRCYHMQMSAFTPHAEVNDILHSLMKGLRSNLGSQLVGVYLYGSLTSGAFDRQSDIDVLVEFIPGRTPAWEFFRWGEELGEILGHKVDLCSKVSSYIDEQVRDEAFTLYEQA